MHRHRHTPKRVIADHYSPRQREDIIRAIVADGDFFAQLHPPVQAKLVSGSVLLEIEALTSVYLFEDKLEYEARSGKSRPVKTTASKVEQMIERMLEFPGMPEDIVDDLQSDRSKIQKRGLAKAKSWLTERQQKRAVEIRASLKLRADRVIVLLGKVHSPMRRLEIEKFLATYQEVTDEQQADEWAGQAMTLFDELNQLDSTRTWATRIADDINQLLPRVNTDDRRQRLERLLAERRRLWDDRVGLRQWIQRASDEVTRLQRRLEKPIRASSTTPGVNWDKQELLPVGRPNANAGPAPTRGQVVAGAGKNSQQKAARKKK